MNAKAEQKARSHETILASAARLLRERGIGGARVADVMEGAGLTVGAFYAHFPSKEALIDEVIRRTAAEMRGRLFDRLAEKPPEARAEVALKRYLSALHRDEHARGCCLPAVVGEVATDAPEHQGALASQVEAMASGFAELLETRPAARGRQLALGLIALMYGGLTLSRALRGTALSDEVLRGCRELGKIGISAARPDGGDA